MKKICSQCYEEKALSEFNKCKNTKDGVLTYCKVCNNIKRRKRTSQNKELLNEWKRNYLKNNPEQHEKHLTRLKKYNQKTKDKNRVYRNEYEKNRNKTDKLFLIRRRIKNCISNSIKRTNHRKKGKTVEILGCSFEEFKTYIESKFESWMNWENYGLYNGELNYGWDLDHIIPTASAKSEVEIMLLNKFTNFQPLCSYVNRVIKKDKLI